MNFLIVGLGGIGQRHLRNLYRLKKEEDNIYAIRTRGKQLVLDDKLQVVGDNLEEKYKIIRLDSFESVLANRIDAAFICTPTALHTEMLLKCVKNGISVFVEKPISNLLEGLDNIAQEALDNNVTTFVGYQMRYHPCIIKAKQILSAGRIGKPLSVIAEVGEDVTSWHKYEDYKELYACRKELGGGVILTQIHELDYLHYLFGFPKKIFALGGHISDLEIDVEDVVNLSMSFQISGDSGSIPVILHEDFLQKPGSRNCKIIGSNGKLVIDFSISSIQHFNRDGKCVYHEIYDFDRNELFVAEMKEFMEAVKEHRQTTIPLSEGIIGLKMALAAQESLKSGRVIDVESI